jgi:tripartite-type tricarboxylate transporter receptor subunit TctC
VSGEWGGVGMKSFQLAAAVLATACLQTPSARAQDFFAGKTVTLVVGYQAGSLYDANARFVARHLARFIPGQPTVIVRNMPGAGTLTAANNVANLAPKDGTTIALIARGMALEPLLGGQGVRFEPLALNWIGSTSQEVSVIAVRTDTGVKTLDDVKTRQVVVAGPAPGTDGVTFPTTLNNLLGTQFKVVTGYRSGAEMTLAIERKEVDGRGSWSWASFRNDGMTMLKRGELTLLVQMATAKSPDIPHVPLVMDYAKTDEQRQVLELLLAGQAMAWPVFAPADVPQERVALLRQSYRAMLKDPETLADAKRLGVDVDPVGGEVIADMLKRIYATPPAVIEKVRELAGRK